MFPESTPIIALAAIGPAAGVITQQTGEAFLQGTNSSMLAAVAFTIWKLVMALNAHLQDIKKHREMEIQQWAAAQAHRDAEVAHWAAQ